MLRWGSSGGLEPLLGEGAALVRLQVFLKFERFVFIGESTIPAQFPRFEFSGVSRFPSVMLRYPQFQIRGRADVFLLGKILAADDVDVPHRLPQPVFALRASQGASLGCATRSPKGEAWWS